MVFTSFMRSLSKNIVKQPITSLFLLVAVCSFLWGIVTNADAWASADIRALIDAEARIALDRDEGKVASIYCPDALVRNWGAYNPNGPHPLQYWQGIGDIRDRYRKLPHFSQMMHSDVKITELRLITGTARAISSSHGVMVGDNPGSVPIITVASIDGDRWEFRKVNRIPFVPWSGKWRIYSFTYDLK